MKYNKGRLNDFNVYPRQPRCPAARAAGLRSAASRACGLHPPTRPRAGGRAAAELVAGLVAWLAGQGQRHGAIKLQLHVRRAGPDARPLPLPPEFGADALLAAEAARVAIGDVVM